MLQNMRRRDGILPRLGDDPLRIARLDWTFPIRSNLQQIQFWIYLEAFDEHDRVLPSDAACRLCMLMLVSPWEIPKKNRRHYEGSDISWSHRPKSTSEAQPRKGPAVSTAANSMPTPVLRQNWPPDFAVAKVPRQASSICTLQFSKYQDIKSLTLRTKFLQKFTRLPNLFHLKYPTNFHEEEVMARSSPSSPWQSWKLDISARRGWRFKKKKLRIEISPKIMVWLGDAGTIVSVNTYCMRNSEQNLTQD